MEADDKEEVVFKTHSIYEEKLLGKLILINADILVLEQRRLNIINIIERHCYAFGSLGV